MDSVADVQPIASPPWYDWTKRDRWKIGRRYREWLFKRDGYVCRYCRRKGGALSVDHWLPRSRGGTNKPTNLVTACMDCNLKKGGHIIQWRPV